MTTEAMSNQCRFCGALTAAAFSKLVQGKIPVGFHRCGGCGSLQTDRPTWLEEAYRNYPGYGVDAAQRAVYMQARVLFVAKVLGLPTTASVLDYGGGSGLVARLLRDVGFDAYVFDPFAPNVYAAYFDGDPAEPFDVVTAFEVLEHLPEPRREIDALFRPKPRLIVASTQPYRGEGADWPYLHEESGQHVFFWSERALSVAGAEHGYDCWVHGTNVVFFHRPITPAQRAMLRTHHVAVRLLCGAIPLMYRGSRYAIIDERNLRGLPVDDPRGARPTRRITHR